MSKKFLALVAASALAVTSLLSGCGAEKTAPDADVKETQAKVSEVRKSIRIKNAQKRNCRNALTKELAKPDCDKSVAQILNAQIEDCDRDIAALYRKAHTMEKEVELLMQGGGLVDAE